MKKNFILTALVASFLVLSMAATSDATTFGVNVIQTTYKDIVSGSIKLAGTTYGGVYMRYGLNLDFTEPTPYYWPDGYYKAFCVEALAAGSFNNGYLTELNISSPIGLKMASWLIYKYPTNTSNDWAALQLAVWEAAFDPYDLSLTNTASNTYYTGTQSWSITARTYITTLKNSGINWATHTPYLTGWVHDLANEPGGKQNFLVQSNPPIPEPSTLLLLGTGLLGFGVVARYRRNKKA